MQNIGALQESLTVGSNPFNTNPRYGQNSQMQANRFVTQSPSGPQGGSGGQYRPNFNRGGNAQGQSRGNFNSAANERFHNSGPRMQNLRFGNNVRPMYLLHDGCRIDDDCDVVVNHGVRKVDDELYCDADDVGTENDCDNCVDDN